MLSLRGFVLTSRRASDPPQRCGLPMENLPWTLRVEWLETPTWMWMAAPRSAVHQRAVGVVCVREDGAGGSALAPLDH